MKPPQPRRKCLHCKELFLPDYRGGQRQCYCLKPDCRKARKRELMRAWLAKPENQNYFRDDGNAQRARDWQKEHPGYWKNTARYRRRTLQDGCREQVVAAEEVTTSAPDRTLQDLCSMQVPLFAGLIPTGALVSFKNFLNSPFCELATHRFARGKMRQV